MLRSKNKDLIIFPDAGTVNFGDLSLEALKPWGHCRFYSQTPPSKLYDRVRSASIVITNKCRFDRALLKRLPELRCIHLTATGVNNIDLDAAREFGVAVTNVPNYSTETMAQSTLALILALACDLIRMNDQSRNGKWSKSPFAMMVPVKVTEIKGKVLGVIGYGNIGRRVAALARAFGMKVLIGRIPGKKYSKKDIQQRDSFEKVIRESDFLTLHVPLTPLTRNLIHRSILRKMKHGSYIVNVARGGVVNELALREALDKGHLAGAAVDVLTEEPPPRNHILMKAPNLIMTPHALWASLDVRKRLVKEVALNMKAFYGKKRRNRIV